MDYHGQTLCEVCYMHAMSPARACDPWAVRSAQTLSQVDEAYADLSESQAEILQVLKETGGVEASVIAQRLEMKLPELERELATLRHMEKIRGEMRDGIKIVRLW
jgi:predicted HTH transcriptional regulator